MPPCRPLEYLVKALIHPSIGSTGVIQWGSPVPSFGDISRSKVATLGLNPSNREFMDRHGNELRGPSRRFHTLNSLGISSWCEATASHYDLIFKSCRDYFACNPYDTWFRQLDHIISGTAASYYEPESAACHLDLIPFATTSKWTDLTDVQKKTLLHIAGDTLGRLLHDSPVRLLILNGRSVVNQFQDMTGITLDKKEMLDWSLRRAGKRCVLGFAYEGEVSAVAGVRLRRKLLVLGFNHNIQSSFGVTRSIRNSIRLWVAKSAREVKA
jgi:hypothetical protein